MKPSVGLLDQIQKKIKETERGIAQAIYNAEREVRETVQTIKERDPAARSTAEVLLLYSGVHAIMAHRVAHGLYKKGRYFAG